MTVQTDFAKTTYLLKSRLDVGKSYSTFNKSEVVRSTNKTKCASFNSPYTNRSAVIELYFIKKKGHAINNLQAKQEQHNQ